MSADLKPEPQRRRPGRAERSDSIRNREKLIAVAQAVFAAEGLNAPMDRIAARAGVGPGTLYRHFPSRVQLWEVVLEEPLLAQLDLAQRALDNPDRWVGLSEYIVASCALEAERNGYLNLMTTRFEGAPKLLDLRAKIQRTVKSLVSSARDDGAVRADFTMEDLIFVMLSNSRVAEVTRSTAPDAWRRNVELFLEAIRPERAHPLRQRPMTPSQVYRSMTQPALAPSRPGGNPAESKEKN
jgi:AcrR family transcriptional regulator